MSFISSYIDVLKDYQWSQNIKTVKDTVVGSIKSKISATLPTLSALNKQSSAACGAFREIFNSVQDYIDDKVFTGEEFIADFDNSVEKHVDMPVEDARELIEAISDLAGAIGEQVSQTEWTYALTSNIGGVYKLVVEKIEDEWYALSTEVDGECRPIIDVFVDQYQQGKIWVGNGLSNIHGRIVSLVDVLYSVKENELLTGFISKLTDQIMSMNENFDLSSFPITDEDLSFAGIRTFWSVIRNGWTQNGVMGVISGLIYYTNSVSHIQEDEDGNLVFTDNSKLIPAAYATGLIKTIVTTVVSAISTIVMVVGGVVGKVIGLIGNFISVLIQSVNYDSGSNTTASLVDNFDVGYPVFPHGFCARESDEDWKCVGEGVQSIFTSGGKTFFSTTYDQDNDVYTARGEFHPDLVDRRALFKHLIRDSEVYSGGHRFKLIWPDSIMSFTKMIQEYVPDSAEVDNRKTGAGKGTLSESNDRKIREIAYTNLWLFILSKIIQTNLYDAVQYGYFNVAGAGSNVYCRYIQVDVSLSSKQFKVYNLATDSYYTPSGISSGGFVNNELQNMFYAGSMMHRFGGTEFIWYAHSELDSSLFTWTALAESAQNSSSTYTDVSETINWRAAIEGVSTAIVRFDCKYKVSKWETYYGIVNQGVRYNWYYDSLPEPVGQYSAFAVKTPKYEASTFWQGFYTVAIGAAIATVAAVVVSTVCKKKLAQAKATRAAKLESAWGNFLKDPSTDNYKNYKRAVKRNNLSSKIFGGTQYSIEGLWGDTGSSESVTDKIRSVTSLETNSDDSSSILDAISEVKHLITGDDVE